MIQNKINLLKLFRCICLVCICALGFMTIVATGGGDGGNGGNGGNGNGDTITGFTISGLAAKGLVSGGTVEVYAVTDDGQKGDLLGSATTDSDGAYSVDIGDYDGPVLVEVTGGTYLDEATGQTMDLDGTLRAALPSVSGDVDVAVTPLTEIGVRMAEAGGGLDAVKIEDANELLSQLIGADIISTLPADSSDAEAFGSASGDEQNYALVLAAMSQMSETSGQDLATLINAIEDDIADLELDQTSSDLLAAITDFLDSEDNNTGADDAAALVAVINEIVANGFQPTGDLADAKVYLADFLKDPTDDNYNTLMDYMDTFVPESAEAYLFTAMANLMDIYRNTAVDFLTDNGLTLDALYDETFNGEDFLLALLNLSTLDTDIAGLFAALENRLEDVYDDLTNAEGAKTFISLMGFDTIFLDDVDVKILKTITNALKSVFILIQAVDLSVDNWEVTSGAETVDVRTLIESEVDLTDDQMDEFLSNNPDLFTYSDLTKLDAFRSAFQQISDDLEAVFDALDALGSDGREMRVENAFNIDSDLDFYMLKAINEETMPSILSAMDVSSASIVVPSNEFVSGSVVLVAVDGYSYCQYEYDIYLRTFSPVEGAEITLYDLVQGEQSLRDLMDISTDPYEEGDTPELYMEGVEDIEWENPVESFTVPAATIVIDGDESDWDSVPVFQSGGGFTFKIAAGEGETYYIYASIPADFNLEEDLISCNIVARRPMPTEPTGYFDFLVMFGTYFDGIELTVMAVELTFDFFNPPSLPPPSQWWYVTDENKALVEADGSVTGLEIKFSHFDLLTADNYLNNFIFFHSDPPQPVIAKDPIKLYP